MRGRVLIVAGSDSGGGAGIQADIKTVTALGGFAMTAVTALTAQNTEGVFAIHEVPPGFVAQQMRVVLSDIGADCIKIGMLHRPEIIEAVAAVLVAEAAGVPVVVDPVMVAKGGAALLAPEAMNCLKERMVPCAAVLTPNLPEAEAMSGISIADRDDMERVGAALLALGPDAVLLKGGHLEGEVVTDLLFAEGGTQAFEGPRIATTSTHGTGCTLASAVAASLTQGIGMGQAVARARDYVRRAIETAPGLGRGHGPLNHAHAVTPYFLKD